ncbi:class I SAM-dependent methyltransferase [Marinomonas algicola]|uniref:class I SAM-dependent methyltransferase n=1 Tax=Marinomonas algicola TaxID=2773454 RepID=UPI00174B3733|nr:class I SAM-dependent methyltransferase [Marinomonas algicola]
MSLHKLSLLSVAFLEEVDALDAQKLAHALELPCFYLDYPLKKHAQYEYLLLVSEGCISIAKTGKSAPNPVKVDFVAGSSAHRRLYGGGKGQDIAKAIGLNKRNNLSILDATAGLGRDAFVLASLGCHVTLLERCAFVRALLKDGLERAAYSDEVAPIAARMDLQEGGIEAQLAASYDVVYLDPMYPHAEKSAAAKKEMAFFRDLIGHDEDADYLLPLALKRAHFRVVVKRPKGAPFLNNEPPTYQITGKSGRFDVYVNKSLEG